MTLRCWLDSREELVGVRNMRLSRRHCWPAMQSSRLAHNSSVGQSNNKIVFSIFPPPAFSLFLLLLLRIFTDFLLPYQTILIKLTILVSVLMIRKKGHRR